jgi:hypothetical protein
MSRASQCGSTRTEVEILGRAIGPLLRAVRRLGGCAVVQMVVRDEFRPLYDALAISKRWLAQKVREVFPDFPALPEETRPEVAFLAPKA